MAAISETFPAPISLSDLVAACGVDGVRDLALACGALAIEPKPNQVWRCVLEGQVIIGYKHTAVVAGRDELAMAYVSVRLHHMANDAAGDADYHAYAMVMDVRKALAKATRADLATFLPVYTDLFARLACMDELAFATVFRLLHTYAPADERAVTLALAGYERGVQDGLDAAEPPFDVDDDYFLPDPPPDPLPNLVKSA